MLPSRRTIFALAPAGIGLSCTNLFAAGAPSGQHGSGDCSDLEAEIRKLFEDLPGQKAFKIWAPPSEGAPEFVAELHSEERLFSASANKALILCERLRQLDSPDVEQKLVAHELELDVNVWSLGSTVFLTDRLIGVVSERTALEAMISHSDNTATDMILKEATAANVRKFIAAIDLKSTMIPDSTRSLSAYLFGATDYKKISWEELLSFLGKPFVHPVLNDVETLASSASDLVSFYARALQGDFFSDPETLRQFRRVLSLGDITYLVPFPIGMSVFGKAGYFDYPGEHARCIAGGVYFPDRWVYLATIINWDALENDPETVTAYFRATRRAIELVQQALGR